jgi:hypothetical protein
MQLSELQRYFQDYIFNSEKETIKSIIAPPPNDTISERLSIYADGYEGHQVDALEKIFPALRKYSGEELFYDWCAEYIYVCPSTFFSVSKAGEHFPQFLGNKNLLLSAELASLELAIHSAGEAANAPPLTQKILENIPQEKWGDIVFECHPSVQRLTASHDVISLYESLMNTNNKIAAPEVSSIYYRVWRKELQVYYLVMQASENVFLSGILHQLSLGEICEELTNDMSEEEAGNYAVTRLLTWIQEHIITGVKVPL